MLWLPASCPMVAVEKGTGQADWVDALTVAFDSISRKMDAPEGIQLLKSSAVKRVVLVSNFLQAVGQLGLKLLLGETDGTCAAPCCISSCMRTPLWEAAAALVAWPGPDRPAHADM